MKIKLLLLSLVAIALLSSASVVQDSTPDCNEVEKAENNNYVIQLTCETDMEEFIQRLSYMCNSKEEYGDSVEVYHSYDIGGKFKALSVHIESTVLLNDLMPRFSNEIKTVIPDDVQQFFNTPVVTDIRNTPKNENNNEGLCDWEKTDDSEDTSEISKLPSTISRRQSAFEFPNGVTYVAQPDQQDTPWNLIRISEHDLNLSNPYIYDAQAGAGVTAYILDDGLNIDNMDFAGRATLGWSAFENSNSSDGNQDTVEGGGHGTHVAGIIGGTHYGVAKNVSLVAVQVLSPGGTGVVSNLIGGLHYVARQQQNKSGLALINMSLGMSVTNAATGVFDDAIAATIATGVAIVAAAGNSGADACQITPAYLPNVFTVGITTEDDVFDSASNFGACVNILAPGVNITSDYIGSNDATAVMSGSSMSAPHATGVAALVLPYLQSPTVEELWAALSSIATRGKITGIHDADTPNALVFNGQRSA